MGDQHMQTTNALEVEIVPIEEESDDLFTLSIIQEINSAITDSISKNEGLRVHVKPNDRRGGALFDIAQEATQQIVANKELFAGLFTAFLTTLARLSSQRRIKRVEFTVGEITLTIEDIDKADAKELLDHVATMQASDTIKNSQEKPKVTVKVSKK
jgi:hypothetical protein